MNFVTPIYHPNVNPRPQTDASSNRTYYALYLKELTPNIWSPAYTLMKMLTCLYSLLEEPDLNHPIDPEMADMYQKNDFLQFEGIAKEWTQKYAISN